MELCVQNEDGFGFDLHAFGQRGNADGGAGGEGLGDKFRHDFVEDGKIAQVGQVGVEFDDVGQRAACRFGDGLQVLEHLARFGAEIAARLAEESLYDLLAPVERVTGYDTGPGNVLMDGWIARHQGKEYDEGGAWGASGTVDAALLATLLEEPYFHQPAPKSTGRDLFHPAWLQAHLQAHGDAAPADVQATLAELTARAGATSVISYGKNSKRLAVCGGGARNGYLMERIAAALPGVAVQATDALGLPSQQVEAAAFAWLARQTVHQLPGNLPQVTGAAGPRILGAIYPA